VADDYRRRGIARALVDRLGEIARQRGCHGMWVVVDPDNDAALQTYRSARADPADGAVTLSWEF
jgi:ribosomal protein S18 acetylase RimI-like enzyme